MSIALLCGLLAPGAARAESVSSPLRATTSRAARDSAIQSIPFEKLTPEARKKVTSVLSTTHVFRRLPIHVTPCDPDLYLFLVRHPDVVVGIWEALDISDLRMSQLGQGLYRAGDSDGTTGTVEYLYQDHETHVVFTDGYYGGAMFGGPIRGRTLVILKTGYIREPDGRHYITSRLDAFTHIDNAGIEFLTRTFQPIVGKVADSNFVQTSAFVGSLSRTAEVNQEGMQRLAAKLSRVRPEVRDEFAAVAQRVAEKATRQASCETPAVRPEMALAPPAAQRE
ncbi:MAG: hypothetical protein JW809_09015 [Pirellulales bacterium]|nr:hypothetical protein [Pirellulales bacterium]